MSRDSIVVLPKQLVTYMVQDLIRYDGLKQQVSTMDNNIDLLQKQVESQEKINMDLRSKLSVCQSTNNEYQSIDELNIKTIESLKIKLSKTKRQRNAVLLFTCLSITAIFIK